MKKVYYFEKSEKDIDRKRSNTITKATNVVKVPEIYKYYVGSGNNSFLVRRVLSTRKQWEETSDSKQIFLNLKWQQTSKNYKYENCIDNRVFKHSLNHFQFHHELSNKESLYRNIVQYCENNKINAFQFMPITFILNTTDNNFQNEQNNFLNFYHANLPSHLKKEQPEHFQLNRKKNFGGSSSINSHVERKQQFNHSKLQISSKFTSQNSSYLWILKPTFYNRGNGIHVFNKLRDLQTLMNKYMNGYYPEKAHSIEKIHSTAFTNSSEVILKKSFRIKESTSNFVIKSTSFVIQKYLEQPLLFNGRKFDLRVWVLVSHDNKVYFFKQGYMRTSSYAYRVDKQKIDDLNIHLTNNAVQKHNQDYGKYEFGNQLSFKVLRKLVEEAGKNYDKLISSMKEIVKISILSVRKKLNKLERHWCFEIFGYDFMLDNNCQPFLIEVNTNPCIEESSPVLEELLPRMLDDAFCLTIDQIFDSPKTTYNYVVENQSNSENLWQFLLDLKKI